MAFGAHKSPWKKALAVLYEGENKSNGAEWPGADQEETAANG